MSNYHVTSLNLRGLDNANIAQLLTSTAAAIAASNKANRADMAFYKQQLPLLEQKLEAFEAGLHKNRASQVVKRLELLDRERDQAWTTVTKLVRAYSSVKAEPIASSHQLLSTLLKTYKLTSKTSYEEESELIRNFLKELAKDSYRTAITALHLTDPVASLRTAQTKFEEAYKERLNEQSSTTPSQAKQLRQQLLDQYQLLVDYTAINAAAHPEKAYLASLRDDLNSIRKRYKTVKAAKVGEAEEMKEIEE